MAHCFAQGLLEAIVLEGPAGAASALKMANASYTKSITALMGARHGEYGDRAIAMVLSQWRGRKASTLA